VMKIDEALALALQNAIARFNAMTPEQQAEHRAAQMRSWVRGMTARCEHGAVDYVQCSDCRRECRTIRREEER
jgi:hypothetical protein